MFIINLQYAYLLLCAEFLIVWALIYTYSPLTRHEQIRMSLVSIPGGPLSELLYFRDYWYPQSAFPIRIGPIHTVVEDMLFAFAFAGIVVAFYPFVMRWRLRSNPALSGGVRIAAIVVALTSFFFIWIGVNSIFATSIGFLAAAAWMVARRPGLGWSALWSGVLASLTMFTMYLVGYHIIANSEELLAGVWLLHQTIWGERRVAGIPVTELIWAFSFGTLFGPLYAFGRRKYYV
ncbi:MAG: hypothetical protein WAT81_03020 [Candidatus Moraniibacteriota bacterium]